VYSVNWKTGLKPSPMALDLDGASYIACVGILLMLIV